MVQASKGGGVCEGGTQVPRCRGPFPRTPGISEPVRGQMRGGGGGNKAQEPLFW